MTTTSSAPAKAPSSDDDRLDPHVLRVAWTLLIGGFAVLFDTTIVAVAIDSLGAELGAGIDVIQWVSTGYLLALGVTVPLVGWGQKVLGSKRLWMLALAFFLIGSVLCSLAWDAPSLVGFRVIQGVGGGILMPLMMTLLVQATGGKGVTRVAGMMAVAISLGPILGPVIGGLILNNLDWPWMFWINVPFCIIGLIAAAIVLPKDGPVTRAPLDIVGLLLLAPALVGVLYGLSNASHDGGFADPEVWVPTTAGVVLLAAFALWAIRRGDRALVDLRLLRHRPLWSGSALLFLSGFGLYGAMLMLPLYFQQLRGADVLAAGLLLAPQGIGTLIARVLTNKLIKALGERIVVLIAFAIVGVATIPFAFATGSTDEWWLMAVLLVRGLGLGLVMIPVMGVAFSDLAHSEVPDASIVTRLFQQLGGSFGTAVLATILSTTKAGTGDPVVAFSTAFWWSIAFTGVAVALSLLLPGRAKEIASR